MDWQRYFHTLKYLKPVQFYGRLWFRYHQPKVDLADEPPRRKLTGHWQSPAQRRQSLITHNRARFLDEEHEIAGAAAWEDPTHEKLWLYNLHYFDDLNAIAANERTAWQRQLISRWVDENSPGKGTAYEPYPTALRIVNWIKWVLAGNELDSFALHSLGVQTRWLAQRLEWHLLGNHLFVNAKALVFAGLFFEGPEANRWLKKGLSILAKQIPEQILADGGQFERSPMYHALALEDLLDLLNISRAYPVSQHPLFERLPETIGKMRHWLIAMTHPDGEISFFNDAAIGIAPSPNQLEAYALRMGQPPYPGLSQGLIRLADSGYLAVRQAEAVALLDVAPVGPDYLPGHAHADTLSFELSLFGQRVLVNSGTSRYGNGEERLWQRGTAAHNTVTLDGKDSSEVWGGFRVARRARPFGLNIVQNVEGPQISCAHDGYLHLPGKPTHRREWRFSGNSLEIVDSIEGGFKSAVSHWHFHPTVTVKLEGQLATAQFSNGKTLRIHIEGAQAQLVESLYFPEFGVAEQNSSLQLSFTDAATRVRLEWES